MANQNRQLHGELDADRAKGIELSEQIRVLQNAGTDPHAAVSISMHRSGVVLAKDVAKEDHV